MSADDLVDVAVARGRTSGVVMRRASASARKRVEVALGERVDRLAGGGRAADDLVVDVGDVHDPASPAGRASAGSGRAGRRTGTSGSCRCGPARRPSDRRSRSRRGPRAAGRAAGSRRSACRAAGRSRCRLERRDRERRDRPAGALGAVEVAARRLDVDGRRVEPEQLRRSRRASRRGGRRAAAGRRRSSGRSTPVRQPAASTRRRDLAEELRARDARRRPRVGREEAPEVAQAGRAEQRVGDRVERDVAVGVAVRAAARRRSRCRRGPAARRARTGGCRGRSRSAGREPAPASHRLGRARRSAGSVTLRLPGSPGTTWTGMLQASSSAASSVHVSGPSGGNRRVRVAQEARADALRRLRRRRARPGRPSRRRARRRSA